MRIYSSLRKRSPDSKLLPDAYLIPEAPSMVGFLCGNTPHPGCLTTNKDVRIHSCEKGNKCEVALKPNVVRIQPIVAHLPNHKDLIEAGVGGGGDDLEREAELETLSPVDMEALLSL